MMSSGFGALVRRDLKLAGRKPADALLPLAFFIVAATLFPLGVGPEAATLRQIAPGVMWVCALLSAVLSLGTLYTADWTDGSLEQMVVSGHSLAGMAAAKCLAHWLVTGMPLVIASPLIGLLFNLEDTPIALLTLTLLLGTPTLSILGGIGAALTLGLRNGIVLILLLVLPLCIPVLIFGAGAVSAYDAGMSPAGHLNLLTALLLVALVGGPFATAAALKISL